MLYIFKISFELRMEELQRRRQGLRETHDTMTERRLPPERQRSFSTVVASVVALRVQIHLSVEASLQ